MIADRTFHPAPSVVFQGQSEEAALVGRCWHGWIYQAGSRWFRALPIDQVDLAWRHQVRSFAAGSCESILSVAGDCQQAIDDRDYHVVFYDSSPNARSLVEVFKDAGPNERVWTSIAVVRHLTEWWQCCPPPLLFTPSDIVVEEDGSVRWLGTPPGRYPTMETLQEDPRLLFYVAPEWLRSGIPTDWQPSDWQAIDCYGLGAVLIEMLHEAPCLRRVQSAALRAAGGIMFDDLPPRRDLPRWLDRFPRFDRTVKVIRQLASPNPQQRLAVDLDVLADRLEKTLEVFDPLTAAKWLRDVAQSKSALALLEELFPLVENRVIGDEALYELYCLAGELCARYLTRPLDAIDYYERALQLNGSSPDAFREELVLIASARHHPALSAMIQTGTAIAQDVDQKLSRNYAAVFGGHSTHALSEDDERIDHLVADYYLWRQQYEKAQQFILPRLFTEDKQYVWWDVQLLILYVHALLGMDAGDGSYVKLAHKQLQQIKGVLRRLDHDNAMDTPASLQFGPDVIELELKLAQRLDNCP